MKRILFVDDETLVLEGMRRMLRSMRNEWEMEFRSSGAEALAALETAPFDVVVADMKMPGMDGATLLGEVSRRNPNTIRIILSGHSEKESILKSVGVTHRYIAKPCDPEQLRETITRTASLQALLASESLRGLIAGMDNLPSLPTLFNEIVQKIQDSNASLEDVGTVIGKDIGMSVRVLQLVNSAYFGLARRITSVERAVAYLGLETISTLVLSVDIFKQFDSAGMSRFSAERLWDHSMRSAVLAKTIAADVGMDRLAADDTFTAGMLHDVGLLVLAARMPDKLEIVLSAIQDTGGDVMMAELDVLGVTHADIGAYLLGLWGLPVTIVEAAAYHYEPAAVGQTKLDTPGVVHVAGALSCEDTEEGGQPKDPWLVPLDHKYVETMGVAHRLPEWRQSAAGLPATREVT